MNLDCLKLILIIQPWPIKVLTMSGYTQARASGNNAIEIFVNESGKNVLKTKIIKI
jgi:hypothetical protein